MTSLLFDHALTDAGWRQQVRVVLAGGSIASLEAGATARPGDRRFAVGLAGVANVHSHGFQRGMAGLAEVAGPTADNFWTWRQVMYRFLVRMTPEDIEAVTAFAYAEMLERGFTAVGEFHYLHNAPDGQPYVDVAELSRRIVAAAAATGIGLTLLPTFYAHSGFGGAPPVEGQRRFILGLDRFAELYEAMRAEIAGFPNAGIGIAPHSLRAVTLDELRVLLGLAPGARVHMHVAEQVKEVEDCLAWCGRRPVELLLDAVPVDGRFCLIHLTHMTAAETSALAGAGAIAGLCPVTEANLGDGIFNGPEWLAAGGQLAVGTDSNVLIDLAGEARQLEYAQRLGRRSRNVMVEGEGRSTGRAIYSALLAGGGAALGRVAKPLGAGAPADIVALASTDPAVERRSGDGLIDAWIFAGGLRVEDVWAHGRHVVEGGQHVARDRLSADFAAALRRLLSD